MAARRKKKTKKPFQRLRRIWTRTPVEKPHSTRKGRKGYRRRRDKPPLGLDYEADE